MEVIEKRDARAPEGPTCCSEHEGPLTCDVCDQHILNDQQGVFVCRKCAPLDLSPCFVEHRTQERIGRGIALIFGWTGSRLLAALVLLWVGRKVWPEVSVSYTQVALCIVALSMVFQPLPSFTPTPQEERLYRMVDTRLRLGLPRLEKAFSTKMRDLFLEGGMLPLLWMLLLLGVLGAIVR
jgi:hypothetical protein